MKYTPLNNAFCINRSGIDIVVPCDVVITFHFHWKQWTRFYIGATCLRIGPFGICVL